MHKAVIGLQWGDEGKGKIVDAEAKDAKYIVRCQGGNNAGHTVVLEQEVYKFNLLPSGILHRDKTSIIGNGVVINMQVLEGEISSLESRVKNHGELFISDKAHLIMPWHVKLDEATSKKKLGTTGRGIGPCYADKVSRKGLRMIDLFDEKLFADKFYEQLEEYNWLFVNKYGEKPIEKSRLEEQLSSGQKLKKFVAQTEKILLGAIERNEPIIFEGAQAALLDIDLGTYPYVTSSNTTFGGTITGSGVNAKNVKVIGVLKAYTTRVGEGPFPTELNDNVGNYLRDKGHEFGTTTGRPRRCGWLDIVPLIYTTKVNGVDSLALTKLDVLTGLEQICICTKYQKDCKQTLDFPTSSSELEKQEPIYLKLSGWKEDIREVKKFNNLPENAKTCVRAIELLLHLPVEYIGVGEARDQLIRKTMRGEIVSF